MTSMKARLRKLEQKPNQRRRFSAVIKTIVGAGPDGPTANGLAYANLIGIRAPMIVKSLEESDSEFLDRIDSYSERVGEILTSEGEAAEHAAEAIRADIEAANIIAKGAATPPVDAAPQRPTALSPKPTAA